MLDFSKGLIPAIIQDAQTRQVLMLGYMNEAAFLQTKAEKRVTFYSRSKQRLWTKGETSKNYLNVIDYKIDCDRDTLLFYVEPQGPVCHTGSDTCFDTPNTSPSFLQKLEAIIQTRKTQKDTTSYTKQLLNKGPKKIAQKVGEEAVELILEAEAGTDERLLSEAADLWYHFLVLLAARDLQLADVEAVLAARHLSKEG